MAGGDDVLPLRTFHTDARAWIPGVSCGAAAVRHCSLTHPLSHRRVSTRRPVPMRNPLKTETHLPLDINLPNAGFLFLCAEFYKRVFVS